MVREASLAYPRRMWVSTHVLAGLAIAAILGGPWWLVAGLVVLAHVVMDFIPHWDYSAVRYPAPYAAADFLASLTALLVCWLGLDMPFWMVFMGALSGAPDWDVLIATWRGEGARQWFPSHWRSFPHGRCGRPFGIGVQVAIMAVSPAAVAARWPY
jgi:hypothetical protein